MEWVGLVTWFLVLALALPLSGAGGLVSGSLALQSGLVIGGLVTCGLLIILDGGRGLAWASFGLAVAAAVVTAAGVRKLIDDQRPGTAVGQTAEENGALLAGIELPLLGVAAGCMLMAATGVSTIL